MHVYAYVRVCARMCVGGYAYVCARTRACGYSVSVRLRLSLRYHVL